jgi:CubicO group peptidase (beta-lactamase class C family)
MSSLSAAVLSHITTQLAGAVPGLALAVVTPDGVTESAAVGLSDIENATPMTVDTACNWFSMTKIATATAIMQLVDAGALELDGVTGD